MESKRYQLINRDALKGLAVLFMLTDHLWATVVPGNQWMTYVGRMAFPIFAFQITEGFSHTSNVKRYAKRLLLFALVAEIPFNLFYSGSLFYPFHQNVLFTLYLGFVAIRALDAYRKEKTAKKFAVALAVSVGATCAAWIGFTDYGAIGVLTVVVFYLFKEKPYAWAFQLASLLLLHGYFFQGMFIPVTVFGKVYELTTQGFAVFALVPIHLYNGKKGRSGPVFQYGFYVFYPLHMLVLFLIQRYA